MTSCPASCNAKASDRRKLYKYQSVLANKRTLRTHYSQNQIHG